MKGQKLKFENVRCYLFITIQIIGISLPIVYDRCTCSNSFVNKFSKKLHRLQDMVLYIGGGGNGLIVINVIIIKSLISALQLSK